MRKKKKKKLVKTAREDISHLYPSYIITLSSTTPFLFTPHFSIFHICWYMCVFTRIVIHVNNIIYIYNIVSYICNIPILYIKNRAEATKRENERLSMERCYCVALSSCVGQRSLGRQLIGVGSRGPSFFSRGIVGYRGNRGIRQCRQRTPSAFFH